MDTLALTTTTTTSIFCTTRSLTPSIPSSSFKTTRIKRLSFSFHHNSSRSSRKSFAVFASKDDLPRLNQWEQMELKFGRMIGEDPNLTIAKIMGKRLNPDAAPLDIEKAFYKNKGKFEMIEEVPFDVPRRGKSSSVDDVEQVPNDVSREEKEKLESGGLSGLNLVRPVPKDGVKFTSELKKPVVKGIKKPNRSGGDASVVEPPTPPSRTVPNVILRKPEYFKEDDSEEAVLTRLNLSIKPNLSINMGKDVYKEQFTDMTLIRKPAPISASISSDSTSEDVNVETTGDVTRPESEQKGQESFSDVTMLKKPVPVSKSNEFSVETPVITREEAVNAEDNLREPESLDELPSEGLAIMNGFENGPEDGKDSFLGDSMMKDMPVLKPPTKSDLGSTKEDTTVGELPGTYPDDDSVGTSMEGTLQGKPKRVDRPVKESSSPAKVAKVIDVPESNGDMELQKFMTTTPLKEREEIDWQRATDLIRTGGRADVELISSSTRGFVVSFGSLIGFLPYRNLAAKWKFLAFESWLRRKGLDPSKYRQSLRVIGGSDSANKNASSGSFQESVTDQKNGKEISEDTSMEDLLLIYDQEKIKFLSSFVGQRIKVNVLVADKGSRKLVFSIKARESEELTGRKRNLMARLSIGDVVKCCIKKVTYFGIFVEVEGVLALIHQTEVSWDTTLDPTSMYKIGQVVEAKVHQLDFALERIFLSLKEITPDPLIEALESVVGEAGSLDGMVEPDQPDTEWPDVDSLIRELQQIKGIESVSKGRYFLSPGLAPTFQVYMASMYEKQYKLLARAGNKVQEVIVEASLDKEEMKTAILNCTNRVE